LLNFSERATELALVATGAAVAYYSGGLLCVMRDCHLIIIVIVCYFSLTLIVQYL